MQVVVGTAASHSVFIKTHIFGFLRYSCWYQENLLAIGACDEQWPPSLSNSSEPSRTKKFDDIAHGRFVHGAKRLQCTVLSLAFARFYAKYIHRSKEVVDFAACFDVSIEARLGQHWRRRRDLYHQ